MNDILTLKDFYGTVADRGFRLQHQFQIQFMPPEGVKKIITEQYSGGLGILEILENPSIYAQSTDIPGRKQNIAAKKYLGYEFQIPTTSDYTKEITVEIMSDSGKTAAATPAESAGLLRAGLFAWMNYHSNINIRTGIDGANGGGVKRIPADSQIFLNLLDETLSRTVERYKLFGAFPSDIAGMRVSHADDDVATFSLNIAYQYFTLEKPS